MTEEFASEVFVSFDFAPGVRDSVRKNNGRTLFFDSAKMAEAFIFRNPWIHSKKPVIVKTADL